MLTSVSRKEMFRKFDALSGGVPDPVQYQEFCTLYMEHPLSTEMAETDPFSTRYADLAMQLYLDLRGRAGDYDAHRDEDSGLRTEPNIWREIVP